MSKRPTGTKQGPGLYTYAEGRFTVRRRRGPGSSRWEVLDKHGGGKAVPSKKAAVSWIVDRLLVEKAGDADFEAQGKNLRALNDRLSRRIFG